MEDTGLHCFCTVPHIFLNWIACFPLHKTWFHLSFLRGHVFYTPLILLSSIIPITHIFLEITKIRHSTSAEDLTALSRENTTPCVSHMTLLYFYEFCLFSQQFDIVGFCSVFHPPYILDAILQKSSLQSQSQPLLIDRLFLHKDSILCFCMKEWPLICVTSP